MSWALLDGRGLLGSSAVLFGMSTLATLADMWVLALLSLGAVSKIVEGETVPMFARVTKGLVLLVAFKF